MISFTLLSLYIKDQILKHINSLQKESKYKNKIKKLVKIKLFKPSFKATFKHPLFLIQQNMSRTKECEKIKYAVLIQKS